MVPDGIVQLAVIVAGERFHKLQPAVGDADYEAYLQWLHYAEGMIMPHVNILVVETRLLPEPKRNPVNIERSTKQLTRMLGAVDKAMEGKEFLAGDFSGADIMTGHACTVGARLGEGSGLSPLRRKSHR